MPMIVYNISMIINTITVSECDRMLRLRIIFVATILLLLFVIIVGPKEYENAMQASMEKSEAEIAKENKVAEYLRYNHSEIDVNNDMEFLDLAILDDELVGKEIFLTGEVHGIKANLDLHMEFLKYFKEKIDFKYYLSEFSYSNAYFLNKYLETGDVDILEDIFQELKGSYSWNNDSFNFWIDLYDYNKTFPDDRKIEIIGVDIELQPTTSYRYLVDVLPKEESPVEIKKMIDNTVNTFNRLIEYGYGSTYGHAKDLQKDIAAKESIYRKYLGEDYFGFKTVVGNLLNYEKAYKNKRNQVDWNNLRDEMIYENFVLIQRRIPKGKFFGQWGVNHLFQNKERDIKWFATYLNENELYKDKVLSIAFNYENSLQMGKMGDKQYIINEIDFIFPYMKVANDTIGGNMNLYKLNGRNSPFKNIPMHYTFNQKPLDEPISDFIQYILYIKDSGPTEPRYYY